MSVCPQASGCGRLLNYDSSEMTPMPRTSHGVRSGLSVIPWTNIIFGPTTLIFIYFFLLSYHDNLHKFFPSFLGFTEWGRCTGGKGRGARTTRHSSARVQKGEGHMRAVGRIIRRGRCSWGMCVKGWADGLGKVRKIYRMTHEQMARHAWNGERRCLMGRAGMHHLLVPA